MVTSPAGRERIKKYENLALTSYRDSGGIWTVGYGHVGIGVGPGLTITQVEADAIFLKDLIWFEHGVARLVGETPVNQNEFDALVSFAFNEGLHALQVSTLLKKFKAGDRAGAAEEFARWINVDHKHIAGLIARRKAERDLFLTPC